jgi:hypothetical protein
MRADLPRRRSEPVQRDGEIYQFGCMRGRGGSNISQVPLPLCRTTSNRGTADRGISKDYLMH